MLPPTKVSWAEPALLTGNDLLSLPENGWRYELVQGRLVRMPPRGWGHGSISTTINAALYRFVTARGLGRVVSQETGFDLTQPGDAGETILAPDLAFVRAERVPQPGSAHYRKYPRLDPDLVLEVASPSQYRPELAEKARLWLAAGVRLLWVVWPAARQVDVWLPGKDDPVATLGERDQLDGRDVIPGFAYLVGDLFR